MATDQPETRATSDEPRVEMKPAGPSTGYVDGGWWPRSMDPAGELPVLVRALRDHIGQVNRVSYNLDAWGPAPRKLVVDGRVVRCEGFHTMNPNTVTAIGLDSQRVTVLVVPPDTPEDLASSALRTAADKDNAATVEDILAAKEDRVPANAVR